MVKYEYATLEVHAGDEFRYYIIGENRIDLELGKVTSMLDILNEVGQDGWQIASTLLPGEYLMMREVTE